MCSNNQLTSTVFSDTSKNTCRLYLRMSNSCLAIFASRPLFEVNRKRSHVMRILTWPKNYFCCAYEHTSVLIRSSNNFVFLLGESAVVLTQNPWFTFWIHSRLTLSIHWFFPRAPVLNISVRQLNHSSHPDSIFDDLQQIYGLYIGAHSSS